MNKHIEFSTPILVTYLFCRCLDRIYQGDWSELGLNGYRIHDHYIPIDKSVIEDDRFVYTFLHDYLASIYDKHRDTFLLLLIADYLNCLTKFEDLSRMFHNFPYILFILIPENELSDFISLLDESSKQYFRDSLDIGMLGKTHLFE